MPMYDFKCSKCNKIKELLVKTTNTTPTCDCGCVMYKEVSKSNFELKGNCWEKDGYK